MINGTEMSVKEIGNYMFEFNYHRVTGFGKCITKLSNMICGSDEYVESAKVLEIFSECFANGEFMFKHMETKVKQYVTLERVN